MSRQVVTQEVLQKLVQRLNTFEREIREIRKAIVVSQEAKPFHFHEFPAIKQEQQVEQVEQEELNCTLCSVTKPIDQRERKGKQ